MTVRWTRIAFPAVSIAAVVVLTVGVFTPSDTVAQNAQPQFIVREAKVPKYGALAHTAHVSGTVTVDVRIENGVVTNATPRSGPPLLFDVTVENIRTWTFEPGTTGDFTSSFEYRISGEPVAGGGNPEIELRLPYKVRSRRGQSW